MRWRPVGVVRRFQLAAAGAPQRVTRQREGLRRLVEHVAGESRHLIARRPTERTCGWARGMGGHQQGSPVEFLEVLWSVTGSATVAASPAIAVPDFEGALLIERGGALSTNRSRRSSKEARGAPARSLRESSGSPPSAGSEPRTRCWLSRTRSACGPRSLPVSPAPRARRSTRCYGWSSALRSLATSHGPSPGYATSSSPEWPPSSNHSTWQCRSQRWVPC